MDFIVDGLKTHVATGGRDARDGEPVVILIHGAGMDRTVWQYQNRNIAYRERRVLAIDLPGHGRSEGTPPKSISGMADWIIRFMDAANVSAAILIGHSMGALVALETAARYPERIEKLVLMGVAETMPVHPDLLAAAEANQPLAPELIVFWGVGERSQIGGHPNPGFCVQGASEALLKLSGDGMIANDLSACNDYKDAMQSAKKVLCPTLFVLARDDKMTPPEKGLALAENIADSRSVVIEESGHMMMAETPNQVFDALKGFVF
ncbi:MAG: alpha/beta hydrolase [Rhodospirillales bacterium]|nr:alpha/beta hydrolase [Rhodospirillales bacterium]